MHRTPAITATRELAAAVATIATLLVSKMDVGVWRIQAAGAVVARFAILLARRANVRDHAHLVAV